MRRISWDQLRKHPFWEEELPKRNLPRQPQFDYYVKSKGLDPEEFYKEQEKNSYFIPLIEPDPKKKVDIMRLSITVTYL